MAPLAPTPVAAWASEILPEWGHHLIAAGGFVACTRCLGVASCQPKTTVSLLKKTCRGTKGKDGSAAPRACQAVVDDIWAGRLPRLRDEWPDLGRMPEEIAPSAALSWDEGEGRWSTTPSGAPSASSSSRPER